MQADKNYKTSDSQDDNGLDQPASEHAGRQHRGHLRKRSSNEDRFIKKECLALDLLSMHKTAFEFGMRVYKELYETQMVNPPTAFASHKRQKTDEAELLFSNDCDSSRADKDILQAAKEEDKEESKEPTGYKHSEDSPLNKTTSLVKRDVDSKTLNEEDREASEPSVVVHENIEEKKQTVPPALMKKNRKKYQGNQDARRKRFCMNLVRDGLRELQNRDSDAFTPERHVPKEISKLIPGLTGKGTQVNIHIIKSCIQIE